MFWLRNKKIDYLKRKEKADLLETRQRELEEEKRVSEEVKIFERKIVNNFLPITFNICCGCSKEPSH